jgi:stage II sporulation protein D
MKFLGMYRRNYRFIFVLSTLFAHAVCAAEMPQKEPYKIIAHAHAKKGVVTTWHVTTSHGIQIIDPATGEKPFHFRKERVKLTVRDGRVACNGKEFFGTHITIMPLQGMLQCNGMSASRLLLVKKGNTVVLQSDNGNSESAFDKPKNSHRMVKRSSYVVRVLLGEMKHANQPHTHDTWVITCPHGVQLSDSSDTTPLRYPHLTNIVIKRSGHQLLFNGKALKAHHCIIAPLADHLSYNGAPYEGIFMVHHNEHKSLLINGVDLESYVYSVLKTESWPGWPLEVNKVFAIVSRTYAMTMLMNARKKQRLYDVKNSNLHQTYTGVHTTDLLKMAVDQTKGTILTYNNEPILAMFDCCCGGVIPADIEGVLDFQKAPYLARTYPCLFCKDCKIYRWRMQFEWSEIEKRLQAHIAHNNHLRDMVVLQKDKAGLPTQIMLKTTRKPTVLTGKQLYSLFKEVKSFCFDIHKRGRIITIAGRGYGHHIGLCQWGARHMVREGWDYKRIIQFYYPGVSFGKLAC